MKLAEKMAKKAFEDPKFQQSWQVHMGAFGPVLEGCFREDYEAKVHLCAALNHLSRRAGVQGRKKLEQVEKRCVTDTERAAVWFFHGISYLGEGDEVRTIVCFRQAVEGGLRFYMPYMKLAKFYQTACRYARAEEYYRGAIACYDGKGLGPAEKTILGSAYTGLGTCMTMMHRYEEAERILEISRQICPDGPGRAAVEAVLAAAQGQAEQAFAALEVLKAHAPQVWGQSRDMVQRILDGADPMFCHLEPDKGALAAFWDWFREKEANMTQELLERQCNALFPQAEDGLRVELEENRICLMDYYFTALTKLYEQLLDCCPEDIRQRWSFALVHEPELD